MRSNITRADINAKFFTQNFHNFHVDRRPGISDRKEAEFIETGIVLRLPAVRFSRCRVYMSEKKSFKSESAKNLAGLNSAGYVVKAPRAMPEANDFNFLLLALQPVDYTIRTAEHLPQIRLLEFWHDPPNLWKSGQAFSPHN